MYSADKELLNVIYKDKVLTKTALYILPIVVNDSLKSFVVNSDVFYNCYLEKSVLDKSTSNRLCLVFKNLAYEDHVFLSDNFENELIGLMFRIYYIPFDYSEDVLNILNGKYSELSSETKNVIKTFWGNPVNIHDFTDYRYIISKGLYPQEFNIKSHCKRLNIPYPVKEILSKPKLVNEVFKPSKLYTLVNYE